jgi:membrane-associated protease RseP (regulator of RpoE activity)
MRTTFSRIAKVLAAPLAIALLEFILGLPAMGAQDDDKDNSRNSRQAGTNDDSRDSSGSNRDNDRSDRSSQGRQSDQHHKALGVTLNEDAAGNLYILRVLRASPAEQAGLKRGDEILTVDEHRVSHINDLKRALARSEDESVELGILRKGRHQTVKATLGDMDEVFGSENEGNRVGNQRNTRNDGQDNRFASSGRSNRRSNSFTGDNRNMERTNYHRGAALGIALDQGPRSGAWVTDVFPNSPADEAGIRAGDKIVAIDGDDIRSAEDVMQTISQKQAGDRIALDIDRDGSAKTIKAKLVSHEDLEGQMEQSRREGRYGNDGSGGDDDDGSDSANDRETRRNR